MNGSSFGLPTTIARQLCGHEGHYTLGFFPDDRRSGGKSGFFMSVAPIRMPGAQSVILAAIGLPTHTSPLAVMPPARRGTGRAGIAVMPRAGVQASRQPSPARPCGCVRMRGSTSRRLRKRSSPPPFRPQGLPHEPLGHRRTRASQRDRLGPPALYFVAAPYPARPRFTRTRPERDLYDSRLPASGTRRTTATRRPARPSGKRYFPVARSRQTSLCSDCRSSGVTAGSATARTQRTLRSAA